MEIPSQEGGSHELERRQVADGRSRGCWRSPLRVTQDATVSGTVTDSSGGVLPGVTVTALHEATGNTFVAVTNERGAFRLPVRTGAFRITVELPNFATVNRTVELLLGQTAVVARKSLRGRL